MRDPLIVINFKTYKEVDGIGALSLARICQEVSADTGVEIAVCPPMVELSLIASQLDIPVLSQHADLRRSDPRTGAVTLSSIKAAGAAGTLINHSERRLQMADIEDLVRGASELDLETIVCTNNIRTSLAAAAIGPDYIAVEPPELIGGDISVTTADPGIVKGTVEQVSRLTEGITGRR